MSKKFKNGNFINGFLIDIEYKIYTIDIDYVKMMNKIDSHILWPEENDVVKNGRPYLGIVISYNGVDYFAPLSSPKPGKDKKRTGWILNYYAYKGKNLGKIKINT